MHLERQISSLIFTSLFIIFSAGGELLSQVYTTYHWHLQQPIYWPELSSYNSSTYQKGYESMTSSSPHPENNLRSIFGKDDRVAVYQYRIKDAIESMGFPDAGAQISYSGCLVENVMSFAEDGSLGYYSGWENSNREARNWLTSGGKRKLDIVLFTYHHALGPLIDPQALRKEIQIYKELYPEVWGSGVSKGFFPAELSFSERMIPVLVQEGIEWVFVANNHISRACENFPLTLGSGGENCTPPNKADIQNSPQSNWFSKSIDRGCTPTNAYPFSYQPHKAKYVDPETGQEYKITVVPVAQAMSWTDGYQHYGTEDIDQISWASSTEEPILVVLAHDGDNAFGGGFSYYMQSVPQFSQAASNSGYKPSVVEQYLAENPVDEDDVVHVEDGSWVNADGDFGSPDFINWNWPLVNQAGEFDISGGWAEDERNWAVITAAQNYVETAEQIEGSARIEQIQSPDASATNSELAWHFFLPALTSGYMYYGSALDMEVKPTIACNNAVEKAELAIQDRSQDQTPPTIWIPQQLPHNPGGKGFGPLWDYQEVQHSRDFWIWTFVSDVSGMKEVTFYYRLDRDGKNPLSSNQNETFQGGSEVGAWRSRTMTKRTFPPENFFNDPEIDFFEMPLVIADQYYIHVLEPEIVAEGGVLVDYYIEAEDNKGLVERSPILHTYVDTGGTTGGGEDGVFKMDGLLDEKAAKIGENQDNQLFAYWNSEKLYLACPPAAQNDHFIFISKQANPPAAAPWAKSGNVSRWEAYAGCESTNGWTGWFEASGETASGDIAEAVVSWSEGFGDMPDKIYAAFAAYQTQDGGALIAQIPSGDSDGNIDATELIEIPIKGNLNFDEQIDLKDFAVFASKWLNENCSPANSWCSSSDLNQDGTVSVQDAVFLAGFWLE
ncbi:hypothetical protein [Sedimentisphaera salicampi]|uniref:hypothetical protein n=1 Tax=Sedimentisphaera salicampi TaxID=1941349 RepID=UPI000B9B508C|nr:hypothetical protein [Sedimentisphaera salicampi]OXU15881.1 Glycosyl hydrolase family 57 [Sedimentisphaera salicampi]